MHVHNYHRSLLALGFTVPLLLLPIPSLPFWWNVFRVWANLRAGEGAATTARMLPQKAQAEQEWPACRGPLLGECCRVRAAPEGHVVFVPCPQVGKWEPHGPTKEDEEACGLADVDGIAAHTQHAIRLALKEYPVYADEKKI